MLIFNYEKFNFVSWRDINIRLEYKKFCEIIVLFALFHENFENFALRDRKFYAEFRGLRESCYGREILPPSIPVSEFCKYCKSRLTLSKVLLN